MSILEVDGKGRLTLPKSTREALGIRGKVLVIDAGDHLKIIPLPSDPLQVLHGALTTKKSFKELRRQAELTAQKEAAKEGSSSHAAARE